jgi:hypothetical protein
MDSLGINHKFIFSIFDLLFMSLDPRVSRRRRGLSPGINPIAEIGRMNVVLSTNQSALRRTLSDSSSSSFSPLPIIHKMEFSGGSGGTICASSSQSSAPSVIGSLYSHQVPIQSTKNPTTVVKSMVFFSLKNMLQPHCGMFPLLLTWHLLLVHFLNSKRISQGFQGITLSLRMNTWWHFLMLVTT